MKSITIRRPDDFHVHLRQGALLAAVVPHTARQFARAMVMPNTTPPVRTLADVLAYRKTIEHVGSGLEPLMTIKLLPSTTPQIIREAAMHVVAAKLYPVGVTTNSDDGVASILDLYPVFEAMQAVGMVLSIHAEAPGVFALDRETAYVDAIHKVVCTFPRLRVVIEHVSDELTIGFIQNSPPGLAGTLTVHHLLLTLDDVIGGALAPHNFCKPIPKRPADRDAILAAALSGSPKFFLGTDSAPHDIDKKQSDQGAAGVFSAPVALQLLAEIFERGDALHRFEGFCSEHGARFYGLPLNTGTLTLQRKPWIVPDSIPLKHGALIPFYAGRELAWSLAKI